MRVLERAGGICGVYDPYDFHTRPLFAEESYFSEEKRSLQHDKLKDKVDNSTTDSDTEAGSDSEASSSAAGEQLPTLVLANLAQRDRSRAVAVGLPDVSHCTQGRRTAT